MADEPQPATPNAPTTPEPPATASRPEGLPDAYWDGTANAPRFDAIAKDHGELSTLREFKTKLEAGIPADGKYEFALPEGFKVPDGYRWEAHGDDPLAKSVLEFAKTHRLSKDTFGALNALYAEHQMRGMKAEAEMLAAETKALGTGAETRRAELKTWIYSKGAGLSKEQADAVSGLLDYRFGVEALEGFKKLVSGNAVAAGVPGNGAAGTHSITAHMTARQKLDYANSRLSTKN